MKKTPLKRTKGLESSSAKQRIKNDEWKKIVDHKAEMSNYRCQWCGKGGQRLMPEFPTFLAGHHIIKRSKGRIDTPENCYVCHNKGCHLGKGSIHDMNVDLEKYPNKESWEARDE